MGKIRMIRNGTMLEFTPCEDGPKFEKLGNVNKFCCFYHAERYVEEKDNGKQKKLSKSDNNKGDK